MAGFKDSNGDGGKLRPARAVLDAPGGIFELNAQGNTLKGVPSLCYPAILNQPRDAHSGD